MAAPFVGKTVTVLGTSRAELNGSTGFARDYDREKGRYNVDLVGGKTVALKPANLQEAPGGTVPPQHRPLSSAAPSSAAGTSLFGGISWQQVAFLSVAAAWVLSQCGIFSFGGASDASGLWGSGTDDGEYDDADEAYLVGRPREVVTLDQLRGTLAHHADNTGLPVVVDFYSHSCGPCRLIAPAFKRIAMEFKGRVVFLKVDVNRNYEASAACHVRGMPTFQFYLNRKQVFQFSGADERALRRYTTNALEKAEEAGIYVGHTVTAEALRTFYETNDPSKADEVSNLAEKYAFKTALLMRVCRQKYSRTPETSPRSVASTTAEASRRQKERGQGQAKTLDDFSVEELEVELQRRKAENSSLVEDPADEEFPLLQAEAVATSGVHDVVIVGGGPAGLAAATYTARSGLQPLVIAPAFGGQLLGKGVDVENYPGVVGEHATGRGLVELMRQQARSFDARFVDAEVFGVDFSAQPLRIRANGTAADIRARAVILACGAESRWLQVEGEHTFRGNGVSACATCDGFLYRGKDVVVIGGGDHAMEDALHLARTSRQVIVIHRGATFRASKVLADRVLNHSNIRVRWNTTVRSFHGGNALTHVILGGSGTSYEKLKVDGAFVAIGHLPQTNFLRGQIEMDPDGYVALRGATTTSVPGVFAAGDVADRTYRQAATASGTGVMAALDAEKFLSRH